MTTFSATDAALEGFRISRERPRAILACALFTLAISVAGVLIEVNMPAEARSALAAVESPEQMEIGPLLEAMVILSPLLLFGLAVQCTMATAVYRILLDRRGGWLGYFKFGPDELRLMALTMIFFVLAMIALAVGGLATVLIAALAAPFGEGAVLIIGTLAWVASLGALAYGIVRLSLAPVITFDEHRLALFDSWSITKGHFWGLLGAYVLAVACVIVVAILSLLVFLPIAGLAVVLTGGNLADVAAILTPEEPTLSAYLNPLRLAYMVVSSLFTALWYAVMAAPGAYAYTHLAPAKAAPAA